MCITKLLCTLRNFLLTVSFCNIKLQKKIVKCTIALHNLSDFCPISDWLLAVLITLVNCVSVRLAARVQDASTIAKTLALLAIIVTGIVRLAQGNSLQNMLLILLIQIHYQ